MNIKTLFSIHIIDLFCSLLCLLISGCSEHKQAETYSQDAIAHYHGGIISSTDIIAFDEVWPANFAPASSPAGLLQQAAAQGFIPSDVATSLSVRWPKIFSSTIATSVEQTQLSQLTDEDIAYLLALERICLKHIESEQAENCELYIQEQTAPINLFFLALDAGWKSFSPLKVTEEEIEEYWQSHQSDYLIPAQVDIRHLFISTGEYPRNNNLTDIEARKLANELFSRLKKGEPFSKMIEEFSDSETKQRGGWIKGAKPQGLRSEVRLAIKELAPGEFAPPVKTDVGYHIVRLIDRKEESHKPIEDVRDEIEHFLINQKQQSLYEDLIRKSEKVSPIAIYEKTLDLGELNKPIFSLGSTNFSLESVIPQLLALEEEFTSIDRGNQLLIVERVAQGNAYLNALAAIELPGETPALHFEAIAERFKRQALTESFLEKRTQERLLEEMQDRSVLEKFHKDNISRYRSPWKVRIATSEIPLPEQKQNDPIGNFNRHKKRLETARQAIDKLRQGVRNPQADGIKIQQWRTRHEIQTLDEMPKAMRSALVIFIGNNTNLKSPTVLDQPVESEGKIMIVRIDELQEPKQMTLQESMRGVVQEYENMRRPQVLEQIKEDLLQEAGFEFIEGKNSISNNQQISN